MKRIKDVYSRRTKKEKILTVGVLAMMVLFMLLVTARCTVMPVTATGLPALLAELLLWIFAGDIQILGMAVYLVCTLPVIVLSAAAIDELSQKKTEFALPFYFYILLFFVEPLFYKPMAVSVVTWLVLILFSAVLYYRISGWNSKLLYVMTALAIVFVVLEKGAPLTAVFSYVIFMLLNTGAAFLMNRASVLKKKYWLAVMLVIYAMLFGIGLLF